MEVSCPKSHSSSYVESNTEGRKKKEKEKKRKSYISSSAQLISAQMGLRTFDFLAT